MSTLSVWAPTASRVEVVVGAHRAAMAPRDGGWWEGQAPSAGADYAFSVDGGEPLPDPRSRWQPHGVHGPSRVVDPRAFRWTDAAFRAAPLASGLVYEMHVGTFTPEGTFDAATARLDALVALGATHVELMPIAEFAGERGWGYDGVDLFAPHHAYGGPHGFARFVDACHARGLAVIVDVVYNHLGPSGAYLARFGPYFTRRTATPWGEAVNLDGPGSDEVRRFFCDAALAWLRDYHVDGLRVDAIHAFLDGSAVHFLEQLADEAHALGAQTGRTIVVIAESDLNDPRVVRPTERGGLGFDAQWNEDFQHALHAALTGERAGYYADFGRLDDVARALGSAFVLDGRYSKYRGRRHGRPAPDLAGDRFVGYLQNHDQIGNRPRGERLAELVGAGRAAIGAALVLTAPFVPMIFQGEEWGASSPFPYFTDHEDGGLAASVREGRRAGFVRFGWPSPEGLDPQARETFERARLDWSEIEREPHAALLAWYRRLVALRRATPALQDGRFESVRARFDEEQRWLAVERGPIVVACNLAAASRRIPVDRLADAQVLLAWGEGAALDRDAVTVPADSVAVVGRR